MKKKKISKIKLAKIKLAWLEFLRYCFFLIFIASLGAAVWFSKFYGVARLEAREVQGIERHFEDVFPIFDNEPMQDAFWVGHKRVFPAFRVTIEEGLKDLEEGEVGTRRAVPYYKKELIGFAFEIEGRGYGGTLRLLVGLDPDGKVLGVKLLEDEEPPVFGKLFREQEDFLESLVGHRVGTLKLLDEGGPIHAVSSATITSRGVVRAVREASIFFSQNREAFFSNAGVGEVP